MKGVSSHILLGLLVRHLEYMGDVEQMESSEFMGEARAGDVNLLDCQMLFEEI